MQSCYMHKLQFNIDEPQVDSGANKSVTNDRNILQHFKEIPPIPVYGVGSDDIACHLTGVGQIALQTDSHTSLQIKVYYSPTCSGTIISPNAVVRESRTFTSWSQTSHLDVGHALVQFFNRQNPHSRIGISLHMHNSLWYSRQPYLRLQASVSSSQVCYLSTSSDDTTIIHKLTKPAEYELWHQRLMHVGHNSMDNLPHCSIGVPILKRHDFHSCKICNEMNVTKSSPKTNSATHITKFGQRFQMDYGFMRGSQDTRTNIRSHEGYNCYLLIVDYFTRYTWVFLSKNKAPPVRLLTTFLQTYGNKDGTRIVRTDQGGELARSNSFKEVLSKANYSLEITGSDNSTQNSIAERPHRTLADMVRAGIENSGLHVKYWSDALLHAVYIKNRLPHSAFNMKQTPYERLTGFKPDLSQLRVFGCPIITRRPGKRSPKISKHSYTGIFLRYAKTMKNIVYLDTKTKRIKTTTYATFDEAHYSHASKPPGAKILMELGIHQNASTPTTNSTPLLHFVKQHADATTPSKGSEAAAGYDLYSIHEAVIPPQGITLVDTGISMRFPSNTYGRIASRSGLTIKNHIETKAGVIDPDYMGTIKIVLFNFGTNEFTVKKGERIAQLILENFTSVQLSEQTILPKTKRGTAGFGSTDVLPPAIVDHTPQPESPKLPSPIDPLQDSTAPHIIPDDNHQDESSSSPPIITMTLKSDADTQATYQGL